VIYVGGGSLRNMLAIWREHGVDAAMRRAWSSGVVLAGLSAGAMCWFQGGISMSGGAPEPVSCLGLLQGSMSVHLDGEPLRFPVYRAAVASGRLPPGYAADDGAAMVFAGTTLLECVASRPEARVLEVRPDGAGGVAAQELPVRRLGGTGVGGARPGASASDGISMSDGISASDGISMSDGISASDGISDFDGISELRTLRAGRRRWE
jgi:dipeptidase E